MNVRMTSAVVGLMMVTLSAGTAGAHHTIAWNDDITRRNALNGIVTRVDWKFPHVIVHLDVDAATGRAYWDVETKNPQGMRVHGLSVDSVLPGDIISVEVFAAKDGSHHGAVETITLASGATVNVSLVPPDPGR
jgi:Family of unknown function (DUF6152)